MSPAQQRRNGYGGRLESRASRPSAEAVQWAEIVVGEDFVEGEVASGLTGRRRRFFRGGDSQRDSVGERARTTFKARPYFKANKAKARERWEKETGQKWPTDDNKQPWPAEHPKPLKEGGDPMKVEPRDPSTDPHAIPGADGLTDYQRWGQEGTPAREAKKKRE